MGDQHARTIVINFGTLDKFGGIQKHIYYVIKFMSENGVRVIWLKNKNSVPGEAFAEVLSRNNVEIVNVSENHLYWFKYDDLSFSDDEAVVVASFTVFDMIRALSLKNDFPGKHITCIYSVPDITGNFFFIERYFSGFLKKLVYNRVRKSLSDWNDSGVLLFFADLQIDYFERNYHIKILHRAERQQKGIYAPPEMKEDDLEERSKREGRFNIVTLGRFDFPHKGYMLGLVRAFDRLKSKYPQITLTIIGKGKHESILRDEIDKLDDVKKRDIRLVGEVPNDKLYAYYKDMHLSVAVAGAATDASRLGVLSLIARNHCKGECEVYGYMPEKWTMNAAEEPGELVDDYIEEAIRMSREEYKERCLNAYKAVKEGNKSKGMTLNPWFYFDVANKCEEYEMQRRELNFYVVLNYIRKLLIFLHLSR